MNRDIETLKKLELHLITKSEFEILRNYAVKILTKNEEFMEIHNKLCLNTGRQTLESLYDMFNDAHKNAITKAKDNNLEIPDYVLVDYATEICPDCGYPTFKRHHEAFVRCHNCEYIGI